VAGLYYSFENLKKAITFGFNGTIPQSRLSILTGRPAPGRGGHRRQPRAQHRALRGVQVPRHRPARADRRRPLHLRRKEGYTDHSARTVFYGAPFNVHFERTWKKFTPRAILEFTPMEGALLLRVGLHGLQGRRLVADQHNPLAAVTPLEPEKSTSYELGSKLRLFDNRLTFNVAAYRAKTTNVQVRTLVTGVLNDTNAGRHPREGHRGGNRRLAGPQPDHRRELRLHRRRNSSFLGCTATGVRLHRQPGPFTAQGTTSRSTSTTRLDLGEHGSVDLHCRRPVGELVPGLAAARPSRSASATRRARTS
jgi:iron complex outermembrane receptor protein